MPMLQILYIVAFSVLAIFAIVNLIGNMIALAQNEARPRASWAADRSDRVPMVIHPEMFDEAGNITTEPLLAVRSLDLDEARARLDDLYESSGSDG